MSNLTISDTEIRINNFGENLCSALRQTFIGSGVDDIFTIPTDAISQGPISGEILFALGQGMNIGIRPDTNTTQWDEYSGTITVRLRGQRTLDGPSITSGILSEFNARAARINALMQIQSQGTAVTTRSPFDVLNLPYYSVKFIRPQGIVPYVDWDFNQNVMEMTYGIEFCIAPTAWLTVFTPVSAWTAETAAEADQWEAIAWSPSLALFAAVAANGTNRVMTSPDGITWTSRVAAGSGSWQAITWSPALGLFAAVSNSGGTFIMTSPDATTWTQRTAPGGGALSGVVWSPDLALFVAVALAGAVQVLTSTNGTTWTARTAASTNQWKAVAWSPSLSLFVAVANTGTGQVMTSPDGITWTTQTAATEPIGWASIAWSPSLALFVAVGPSGSIMTSADGITWTARTAPDTTATFTSVVWSVELALFLAVASGGTYRVAASIDGATWLGYSAAEANNWQGVAWSPARAIFAAVSSNGTHRVMIS